MKTMKTFVFGLDKEKPNEIIMVLRADSKLEGHIDEIVALLKESLPMVNLYEEKNIQIEGCK